MCRGREAATASENGRMHFVLEGQPPLAGGGDFLVAIFFGASSVKRDTGKNGPRQEIRPMDYTIKWYRSSIQHTKIEWQLWYVNRLSSSRGFSFFSLSSIEKCSAGGRPFSKEFLSIILLARRWPLKIYERSLWRHFLSLTKPKTCVTKSGIELQIWHDGIRGKVLTPNTSRSSSTKRKNLGYT